MLRTYDAFSKVLLVIKLTLIGLVYFNLGSCSYKKTIDWEYIKKHYELEGDTVKLRAVQFLKANIAGHTSKIIYLKNLNSRKKISIFERKLNSTLTLDSIKTLLSSGWQIESETINDSEILTSADIIQTIDISYARWKETSKLINIPVEVYLEYLLPYKVDGEFPDDWRLELEKQMPHISDSNGTRVKINNILDKQQQWKYKSAVREIQNLHYSYSDKVPSFTTYPSFNEIKLLKRGECFMGSVIATYCMRAAGIPSTIDYIPFWGSINGSHSFDVHWDAKSNMLVKDYPFNLPVAKIFRKTYKRVKQLDDFISAKNQRNEAQLDYLNNNFTLDVTAEHVPVHDIRYKIPPLSNGKIGLICVYSYGEWKPIFYGTLHNNMFQFKDMGTNVLYRIATISKDDKLNFISPMFFLQRNGRLLLPHVCKERYEDFLVKKINHGELSDVKEGAIYTLSLINSDGMEVDLQTKKCIRKGELIFNNILKSNFYILRERATDGSMSRHFAMNNGKQDWLTELVYEGQHFAWPF